MEAPILYMLCGLPASGKSAWAESNKDNLNATIYSSDAIRQELGDVNDQSKNEDVFNILHKRIKDDLINGKNVIYDATNLKRKNRLHFFRQIQEIHCKKICMLFATPYEICLKNNKNRERHVPEEVIKRMYLNFETPWYSEGFDDIEIVYWDYDKDGLSYHIINDLLKWENISHDNPHHTLSIGEHMGHASYHYSENFNPPDMKVYLATLMHDCGKVFTKGYVDSNGNPCETAHYYQHHCVGSYMSLFYLKEFKPKSWTNYDVLYVSLLVGLHMRPYLAWEKSDKAKEKDRKLFGDDIIKAIEIIHECDLAAH